MADGKAGADKPGDVHKSQPIAHMTYPLPASLLARIQRAWSPYNVEEPLAANFRAKQLQTMLGMTPLSMLMSVFTGLLVLYRMAASAQWLWIWMLVLLVYASRGMAAWLRHKRRAVQQTASRRAMQRAVQHATILGTLWGILPAVVLPGVGPQDQLMLAVISCGMVGAGGFALVTVPAAAMAYVVCLTTGSVIGLLRANMPGREILFFLLVGYGMVVVASVQSMAKSYGSRLVAEADAAHKQQIVGLLLSDFEENANDFMWELSPTGHVIYASNRLIKALQFNAALGLVALIARTHQSQAATPADAQSYLDDLQNVLFAGAPFRDQVVPIVQDGKLRWWALTGKQVAQLGQPLPGWRGMGADVTERKTAEDEMHRMAHFDVLTGLANRRHFQHRLQQLCTLDGTRVTLLCIDLDNFKRVNDAYGHANGDMLLKTVALRMLGEIRGRDLVARLGGDEFAILLDGISEVEEVRLFAERLMRTIEAPCKLSGIAYTPNMSIGIACMPQDGKHADDILHRADLALYEAKARGRRQAQFFSLAMDEKSRRRIAIEDALRQALQQQELHLVYQPQIALATQQLVGVEALLRWSSPQFGNLSPAEFIPIAEEAGLIRDIGLWVLETACIAAGSLPDHMVMAVNLSACQFDDALLVDKILAVVEHTGLRAQRLELEITESVFLKDTDDVLTALHRLREAGIRIALDDFGTGYSSLAYLRSFPFNKLKIDRAFVMAMHQSPESKAIVLSVIDLARALHMETTAEGIETLEQYQRLNQMGCSNGQGFYMARPMALDAVLVLLARAPNVVIGVV